jgi:type II secretory pathway pseudopilin PulG
MTSTAPRPVVAPSPEAGFSLLELLVASGLLLIVTGIVTTGLMEMTTSQRTIWNRTEMHSGVRSATELLQQEVGQAGRVALPAAVTLHAMVPAGATTMTLTPSVSGIFVNELLVLDTGANAETVKVSAINAVTKVVTIAQSVDYNGAPLQATFRFPHMTGAVVNAVGGFTTGVIPPLAAPVGFLNGSKPNVLKLYGDINGDGNMVYVEYTCDTVAGNLYRNSMAFDAAAKPALTADQVLLSGIAANPGGVACFQYQMDAANQYVLDVAITLTVNTQQIDPTTRQLQQETKALLNVSPRNVVDAWELVGHQYGSRVQPTPGTVTTLIGL